MHDKERGGASGARIRYVTPPMSAINSTQDLWLGLDTGGTFTDAVLLADGRVTTD